MADLVAQWEVALGDDLHTVEFENGTISGKRIVRVDGKELVHRDWMFKLVGKEIFEIGKAKCVIYIEPFGSFNYSYKLEINGKSYETFTENQRKIMKTWLFYFKDHWYRIVLEKDTLDIWMNGKKLDAAGRFVFDGIETHFEVDGHLAYIKAICSGNQREGLIHRLIVNDREMPENIES